MAAVTAATPPSRINNLLRKFLWGALLIAVLGSVILGLLPRTRPASRLAQLPTRGLGFAGRDLPLSEAEATVFQRAAVVKRLYQVGDSRFVLLAVDGEGDRHAIHDPLYCFRGAGWTVTSETATTIPGGQSKIVRLTKGPQTAEALYWITDGEHRHASALKAWWQSATARLSAHPARHTPVLVLLQPVTGSSVDWQELLHRFPELFSI